jgi:hypothetical protein
LVDTSRQLISSSALDLSKVKCKFEKADRVRFHVNQYLKEHSVSHICVEQNLQAFRPGYSSAGTICTLAQFNGIVQYVCREVSGIIPAEINVNAARKVIGFKADRKLAQTTKEQVFEHVTRRLKTLDPSFCWPLRKLKSGPRKGQETYTKGCGDIADAYVVAIAALSILNIS